MKKWDSQQDWQQNVNEFLGKDFWNDIRGLFKEEQPAYNLYESPDFLLCLFSVPGLQRIQDISVHINHTTITLKGELFYPLEDYRSVHEEIYQGKFERQIKLPYPVKSKPVSASFERGLLIIQLERLEREGYQETVIIEDRD